MIDAFLYFAQKIINGEEGVFFVLDRPEIKDKPIWVMGFGDKQYAKFDDEIFPKFCTIDFLGREKNIWSFENVFSSLDETFCILDPSQKEAVVLLLKDVEKIKLKNKLKSYASETKKSFVQKVKHIQKFESDGNGWVTNLTQNIFGQLGETNNQNLLLLASYFDFLQTGTRHCGGVAVTTEQKFCSFSPEVFCMQEDDKISTYPVKGTGTKEFLTTSEKEISELNMITDLLRNDFGQICSHVEVKRERVLTAERDFHHAHSEIEGILARAASSSSGDVPLSWESFSKLLPAGSVSGAPKKKVVEKILKIENFERKFYTGTFGVQFSPKFSIFNVLIRTLFLGEKHWYFPVGAGITVESDPIAEFEETLDKAKVFQQFCIKNKYKGDSSPGQARLGGVE